MLLSGAVNEVMSLTPELTSIALSSAAEGLMPLPGTLAPVGYQPSWQYWRSSAAVPAVLGVAIEVPESAWYVAGPLRAEVRLEAGEQIVGLRRASVVGPRLVDE